MLEHASKEPSVAKLRNISEHRLHIRAANVAVDPDELVEIPDDVYTDHVWPDTVWTVVSEPKKAAKSTGKGE